MMQTTMSLPRFSNCLPLEWNVHMMIKNSFHGLWHGLKGKGKERDKCFGNMEVKATKTMEQPTLEQNKNKDYQHTNSKWYSPTNYLGNDLTLPYIHNSCSFFSTLLLLFFFSFFNDFFPLFSFFYTSLEIKTSRRHPQFVNSYPNIYIHNLNENSAHHTIIPNLPRLSPKSPVINLKWCFITWLKDGNICMAKVVREGS